MDLYYTYEKAVIGVACSLDDLFQKGNGTDPEMTEDFMKLMNNDIIEECLDGLTGFLDHNSTVGAYLYEHWYNKAILDGHNAIGYADYIMYNGVYTQILGSVAIIL